MSYAQIILAILSIVQMLLKMGQERKWISVGEDRAIGRSLAETLRKSEHAKQVMEEVGGLSDSQLDDGLRDLEPK